MSGIRVRLQTIRTLFGYLKYIFLIIGSHYLDEKWEGLDVRQYIVSNLFYNKLRELSQTFCSLPTNIFQFIFEEFFVKCVNSFDRNSFIHNLNVVISFLSSRHVIHVIKYYVNVKRIVAFNLHHCKLNIRKTSCFSGVVTRKYCAISHALFACRHVLVFCLLFCIYILLTHNVVPLVLC